MGTLILSLPLHPHNRNRIGGEDIHFVDADGEGEVFCFGDDGVGGIIGIACFGGGTELGDFCGVGNVQPLQVECRAFFVVGGIDHFQDDFPVFLVECGCGD